LAATSAGPISLSNPTFSARQASGFTILQPLYNTPLTLHDYALRHPVAGEAARSTDAHLGRENP
jgi:hypothetical protein